MDAEVERRLVHASGAVFPVAYTYGYIAIETLRYVALFGALVGLGLELLRLTGTVDWALFDRLTREYEQDALAGYFLYLFSMTGTVWVFEPRAAVPAMLMLALADPISGLLGADELKTVKRPAALAVMFGVCTLLAVGFVPAVPAVLGGLAAMLADGVKPVVRGYVIDDNLTIPPAAAAAITAGLLYA